MKFFGYESHRPTKEAIEKEVEINHLLEGVTGAAQMLGVFQDTKEGLRKLPLPSLSVFLP